MRVRLGEMLLYCCLATQKVLLNFLFELKSLCRPSASCLATCVHMCVCRGHGQENQQREFTTCISVGLLFFVFFVSPCRGGSTFHKGRNSLSASYFELKPKIVCVELPKVVKTDISKCVFQWD